MIIVLNMIAAMMWATLFVANIFTDVAATRLNYGIATGLIVFLFLAKVIESVEGL